MKNNFELIKSVFLLIKAGKLIILIGGKKMTGTNTDQIFSEKSSNRPKNEQKYKFIIE